MQGESPAKVSQSTIAVICSTLKSWLDELEATLYLLQGEMVPGGPVKLLVHVPDPDGCSRAVLSAREISGQLNEALAPMTVEIGFVSDVDWMNMENDPFLDHIVSWGRKLCSG